MWHMDRWVGIETAMKIATTRTKTAKTKIAYVYQIYVVYYREWMDI